MPAEALSEALLAPRGLYLYMCAAGWVRVIQVALSGPGGAFDRSNWLPFLQLLFTAVAGRRWLLENILKKVSGSMLPSTPIHRTITIRG